MRSEQSLQDFGVLFDARYDSRVALVRLCGHPIVSYSVGQSVFELAERAQGTDVADVATLLRPFAKSLEHDNDNGTFSHAATDQLQPMRVKVTTATFVAVALNCTSRAVRLAPPWEFRVQDAHWRLSQSVTEALASERHLLDAWIWLQRHNLNLKRVDGASGFAGALGDFDPPTSTPNEMWIEVEKLLDWLLD